MILLSLVALAIMTLLILHFRRTALHTSTAGAGRPKSNALDVSFMTAAASQSAPRKPQLLSATAEIEALDAVRDLGLLMRRTGHSEPAVIRELALKKIRSHPRLQSALATMLHNEWCGEALKFLELHEPPDAAGMAGAIRDAFLHVAGRARDEMKTARILFDDSFDADARQLLALADKFQGHGVDFAPAIREFRDALNEPRRQKIEPSCADLLDEWLERHG